MSQVVKLKAFVFTVFLCFAIILCIENGISSVYAQEKKIPQIVEKDSYLSIERVFTGINDSTNMAFLGANDILVLERVSGKVHRIVDGILKEPLIDVNSYHQEGLLGIATAQDEKGSRYVFLYFNEAPQKYGADVNDPEEAIKVYRTLGYDREGPRLYRYELENNTLVNPQVLIDLDFINQNKHIGALHNGGEVIVGPDNAVYVAIGDLDGWKHNEETKAQNYKDGKETDGRAGILRVTQDGKGVGEGILGDNYPLNLYYAYGIRNSFGMDFDPVTGNLWDTENGPDCCDEINLVEPGFNSGVDIVYGMSNVNTRVNNLVDFDGKGKYSDPEFVWNIPVGPTALKFFNSSKFGQQYKYDIFVADFNQGNIYHFNLNKNRTALDLDGPLKDRVADKPQELGDILFATGFGGITDLQVGPDGYLYVLSGGTIYRIVDKIYQ